MTTITATPTTSSRPPTGAPSTDSTGSRLRFGDVFRVGAAGPRARRVRTALSALGVSIGIAAMVGVLGLSESSKSALLDEIAKLGTNLLTVEASSGFGAGDAALPDTSVDAIARIPTVTDAAAIWEVDAPVYRNEFIDDGETGGIGVVAADTDLLDALNGSTVDGVFLTEATSAYPVAVVGAVAAERLGVTDLDEPAFVLIGDHYAEVVGILAEFPLAADLDRSVIIGEEAALEFYEAADAPTAVFARVLDGSVDETRDVLAATADPESPEEVTVTRPSDALEAQAAADDALTTLFLGLGAVALLVGGIGIANVMVIAVIERRGEIGLRRALGAKRSHIRRQFLTEAVILSILGGVTGVAFGIGATYIYAQTQGWRVIIPTEAALGGFAAAVLIGAIAGLYPAVRAARLSPVEALRS